MLSRSPAPIARRRRAREGWLRCVKGTWVGIFPRTGEHIIVLPSGEAIRVRTVHRLPAEDRWDPTEVAASRALPRRPVPQRSDAEPSARTAAREQAEPGRDIEIADQCIIGSRLERPQVATQSKVPRELN